MSTLQKKAKVSREYFSQIFKSGTRLHSPFLTVIYQESDAFHGSVVVGKKVHKKAVTRNKLRRMVYAVLYSLRTSTTQPHTIIVILKPKAGTLTTQALRDHVREQIGRISKTT